ncbi:multicopper oxidase family protein [Trinickia violacea]|uniref:multicopper oxidase family protein n=1 Tax=Trinickia violacea TaxID=2571746 RepID=UPI002690A848
MSRLEDATRRAFLRSSTMSCLVAAGVCGLLTLRDARSQPRAANPQFVPDLDVQLSAREDHVPIVPGQPTRVWRYDGKVVKGDPGSLAFLSNGYLPVLRVRRGQKVRIDFANQLAEPTIIHWHGLYVPASMDGHPRDAISTGQHYVYEFEVVNRAATYWFHAHPDSRTGAQIYFGQAGVLIVDDDEETALGLPQGPYDIPLMIQDRSFDDRNQFTYLEDGNGGMMGETSLPSGTSFPVMKVSVDRRANTKMELPAQLASLPAVRPQDAINGRNPRVFDITMGMMVWGVNGRRFEMDGVTKAETVRHDSTEIWEFRNEESMMLMASCDARSRTAVPRAGAQYPAGLQGRLPHAGSGTDGRQVERYRVADARRAYPPAATVRELHGPVSLPLPHAGARRFRIDAQLPDPGVTQVVSGIERYGQAKHQT